MAKSGATRGPLRRITARLWRETELPSGNYLRVPVEVLECGHVVREKSDIFGPTNAHSRRCKKCGKPAAPAGEGE